MILKIRKLTALSLVIVSLLLSCRSTSENRISINANWKFKLLADSNLSEEGMNSIAYDDSNWEEVSLPHTAHIEPLVVNNQWQGICWYRKSFKVPANDEYKKVFIELEAAMNQSTVWINGIEVTNHLGGYLPVVFDASKYLKSGETNIIAIRLNNTDNPVSGPKPLKVLDFNMYGGLYRNAWLVLKNNVYLTDPILANKVAGGGIFITFPKVSPKESVVAVKANVQNDEKVSKNVNIEYTILFDNKIVKKFKTDTKLVNAGSAIDFNDQLSVSDALLWSPQSPSLYSLETKVFVDAKLVDKRLDRFGIRQFSFKNNELYINGEKTFLRGVNRHQEYPFIGYALSDNAQYRDAKKIKEAGFDYIRLSHYPQSPAFLSACDELGLVVVDAILGWQYYLDSDEFRNFCYNSATNLIRRDRNHPSVLAWEVSLNETQMPIPFMEKLNEIVHAEYPGENVYSCGWKDDVYDIYFQARQHRLRHYNEVQKKPYVVSEYGDWEYYSTNAGLNQHLKSKELRDELSSRQLRGNGEVRMLQQATNLQESHNDNFNTPAFADGYWVMYDYNRGYHDDLESSGLMDIFRIPKFAYYFMKSQRSTKEETVLKIATYWNEQSPLDVRVFSNCDEVQLFLNNKLLATQKPDVNKMTKHLAHAPFTFKMEKFEAGSLKAVGLINGKKVAEDIVQTPQKAVALKMWLDESGKKPQAGCNDVLFLYIAAVDINGTIVPEFSGEVNLDLQGDLELMNVGVVKAEAGIATALIRLGKNAGKVKIDSKSGGLKNGNLKFIVE